MVLLQIALQALCELNQLSGVLNGLFVVGLQDLFLLQLAVGQAHVGGLFPLRRSFDRVLSQERDVNGEPCNKISGLPLPAIL